MTYERSSQKSPPDRVVRRGVTGRSFGSDEGRDGRSYRREWVVSIAFLEMENGGLR